MIKLSLLDKIISEADQAVKTVINKANTATRENPSSQIPDAELNRQERKHTAGLMRVDHTGEVCAQALYRGQAFTAKTENAREHLLKAADEENDHLSWTQQRLSELNSHRSYLNPFWYTASFSIGATAGLISDKVSYSFVMETEHQVMKHLDEHIKSLPVSDNKSRKILQQMYQDESEHAVNAEKQGGVKLPFPVKMLMKLQSKIMTTAAYYI